jgi:hypothetical protein
MYKIEKKDFGVKLTFGDFIKVEEMTNWLNESKKVLDSISGDYSVFVDMRTLKPLPKEAQVVMEEGQKMYKQRGMIRSVVILDSSLTTVQFKRIAKETGIYEWERYIDASSTPNWEEVGRLWIVDGIDPD